MTDSNQPPEIRLDSGHLYREETYTDRRIGTLRKLLPVHADGSDDPGRPAVWEGSTSLLTPAGTLPPGFEPAAETFSDAPERYPGAARAAPRPGRTGPAPAGARGACAGAGVAA